MNAEFLFVALATISAFTTLTTEGVKKILDERGIKYSPNLLAAIIAIVLTVLASIGYILAKNIVVDGVVIIEVVAMVLLSFLCSTLGFDKIKQTIIQILALKKL